MDELKYVAVRQFLGTMSQDIARGGTLIVDCSIGGHHRRGVLRMLDEHVVARLEAPKLFGEEYL
jgi:hypothetical protein